MSFEDEARTSYIVMQKDIRRTDGCLKNSYHVTALQSAGDCDECLKLLGRAYMKLFDIKSHVDFGDV